MSSVQRSIFGLNTTPVRIPLTVITYYDSITETAETTMVAARLSINDCNDFIQAIHPDNKLIKKENLYDEFRVDTFELYQLKTK